MVKLGTDTEKAGIQTNGTRQLNGSTEWFSVNKLPNLYKDSCTRRVHVVYSLYSLLYSVLFQLFIFYDGYLWIMSVVSSEAYPHLKKKNY